MKARNLPKAIGIIVGILTLEFIFTFGIISALIRIWQDSFIPEVRMVLLPTTADQVVKLSLIYTVLLFVRVKPNFKNQKIGDQLLIIIINLIISIITSAILYWFYNSAVWYEFDTILDKQIVFNAFLSTKIIYEVVIYLKEFINYLIYD